MKAKYISHSDLKRELLSDPQILEKYEALSEEYQLISEMLKARQRTGISQAIIAKKEHDQK